jgi:hypothetical protein
MSFIVFCRPHHRRRRRRFDESIIWNLLASTNNKIATYLCPNTPLRAFHPIAMSVGCPIVVAYLGMQQKR